MDFWDVNRKKIMGSTSSHCAVAYGWSPDSRWFLTATCAPRMNVDNDVKVIDPDRCVRCMPAVFVSLSSSLCALGDGKCFPKHDCRDNDDICDVVCKVVPRKSTIIHLYRTM